MATMEAMDKATPHVEGRALSDMVVSSRRRASRWTLDRDQPRLVWLGTCQRPEPLANASEMCAWAASRTLSGCLCGQSP